MNEPRSQTTKEEPIIELKILDLVGVNTLVELTVISKESVFELCIETRGDGEIYENIFDLPLNAAKAIANFINSQGANP